MNTAFSFCGRNSVNWICPQSYHLELCSQRIRKLWGNDSRSCSSQDLTDKMDNRISIPAWHMRQFLPNKICSREVCLSQQMLHVWKGDRRCTLSLPTLPPSDMVRADDSGRLICEGQWSNPYLAGTKDVLDQKRRVYELKYKSLPFSILV